MHGTICSRRACQPGLGSCSVCIVRRRCLGDVVRPGGAASALYAKQDMLRVLQILHRTRRQAACNAIDRPGRHAVQGRSRGKHANVYSLHVKADWRVEMFRASTIAIVDSHSHDDAGPMASLEPLKKSVKSIHGRKVTTAKGDNSSGRPEQRHGAIARLVQGPQVALR